MKIIVFFLNFLQKTFFLGKKLVYKGFSFYKHSIATNKIHWRCCQSSFQCPVRLHTDASGSILFVRANHNH